MSYAISAISHTKEGGSGGYRISSLGYIATIGNHSDRTFNKLLTCNNFQKGKQVVMYNVQLVSIEDLIHLVTNDNRPLINIK